MFSFFTKQYARFFSTFFARGRTRAGLTIVETLVATTILLTAVTAPLVIYSGSIGNVAHSRSQVIASYLAQEAIEFIKFRVYSNFNDGSDWILPDLSVCLGGSPCDIDAPNDNISACGGGVCPRLKLDPTSNLYNHAVGTDTIFTRQVSVTNNFGGNPYDVLVSVRVSWSQRGETRSFLVEEHIFKWR